MNKKILPLIWMLFLSMVGSNFIATVNATVTESGTTLYIDPSEIRAALEGVFTLNVVLGDVADFFGYEFKLFWDNSLLKCTQEVIHFPPNCNWEDPNNIKLGPGIQQDYNETHGRYYRGLSAVPMVEPYPKAFTGNMSLVTLTFKVISTGSCVLDLRETKISDSEAMPIPHDVSHGLFIALARDVAIIEVVPFAYEVVLGETLNISVVAKNEGSEPETFDVTAYYDNNTIGKLTVSLDPLEETTLIFVWDTAYLVDCNYTIKAEASIVPGETDITDNVFVDGLVRVLCPPTAFFRYKSIGVADNKTTVIFDASASYDFDGFVVSYTWDFGDGTTVVNDTNPVVTHNYTTIGIYDVILIVTDNDSISDSYMFTVGVGVLIGDLNNDHVIDIFDVVQASIAFGSEPGHPRWNPAADLNYDGIMDIFDLVILAIHFGETL